VSEFDCTKPLLNKPQETCLEKRIMIKTAAILAALAIPVAVFAGDALALTGDPAAGQKVFNKCMACHTLEAGKNKIGPSLQGVIGRTAGTAAGFNYSEAMKKAGEGGLVWTEENLEKYLSGPKNLVPGNKMPFPGLPKEQDRADVIAYLKSQMK
jgi:cytochrome c